LYAKIQPAGSFPLSRRSVVDLLVVPSRVR